MRSLLLAALLALPLTAIALPVNEDVHYFEMRRCNTTEMVVIITHNRALPIVNMDRLTRRQLEGVRWAKDLAREQGNAYVVEMPAEGKCHEL